MKMSISTNHSNDDWAVYQLPCKRSQRDLPHVFWTTNPISASTPGHAHVHTTWIHSWHHRRVFYFLGSGVLIPINLRIPRSSFHWISAWKVGVGLCSVLRFTGMGKFRVPCSPNFTCRTIWMGVVGQLMPAAIWGVGGGNTVINVLPTGKRRCCCWSLPYHDDPRITLEYWRTISSRTFQEKTPFYFNNSTTSLDHFIIQDFIFQIQIPVFRFSHKSTTITQPSL